MGEFVIKLPDIGEGVAEAELVEWLVEQGQTVREDDPLAAVMTDKATVEIPSPVDGKVIWLGPAIGDAVAVGLPIIRLEVAGEGNAQPGDTLEVAEVKESSEPAAAESKADKRQAEPARAPADPDPVITAAPPARLSARRAPGTAPIASPAVRSTAMSLGVDLRQVPGTGPAGRITREDLDRYAEAGDRRVGASLGQPADTSVQEIRIVGLRRKIAERMATAKARIPHFSYIDEIDMTSLEDLRAQLNQQRTESQPKLTLLPFLMRAMVKAIADKPQMNSLFDDDAGIVRQYGGVHVGIAVQTDNGLVVPVIKHVESLSLWDCAREVERLSEAARQGRAERSELSGSTITITSLGAMGGVATTPVINRPEVAILGVNKMRVAPIWDGAAFRPRKVMNVSSSFDHRVIDGWDAALFIQRIKALLETPAMIFLEADQ